MADIDNLSIQISSDSKDAVAGVEALAGSLGRLRDATSGGLGLRSVANGLTSVKDAVDGMGNITNKLNGLHRAIQTLTNLGNIKVSASIGNQIKNIGEALSTLNVGDGATKITELVTALRPLETLGKSSLGTTVNALNKLPEAMKKLDTRQLYTQIQSLTRIMQPLAVEMQKIANGFNAFPSRIQRLIADNERLTQSNNRTGTSYINLWAKMRMAYNYIRTGARLIGSAITKMNDYIENVNLFNVSMGEYAKEAGEYAEKVGEIMGIDPGEWMRNQGMFMTLATGFGVVSDRAYIMSKNLTQLGYDLSSFFNISYEDAMAKLQSGIAGELEPLRRIGYDLSQARLQQEAYTLGITKKISAMTQAEKAELRYHAILTQVTTAQGDMARTLNAPANQLRILSAQVTMAARAIGSIFIPILNAVLPYIIAVAKVVRILASTIASLFGFKLPEVDYSGMGASIGGAADAADNLGSGLGNAADNAKKLQKYTMGFDELNVIDPTAGASGSGGGGGGGAGGGGGFDFELPEYDFLEGLANSKIGKIVEDMKEWLGLTEEINTWAEFFDTNLGQIVLLIGEIGLGLLGWKITTSLMTSIVNFKGLLSGLGQSARGFSIALGATVTITSFIINRTALIDAIRNGVDGLNFAEILGSGAGLVAGGAWLGKLFGSAVLGASLSAIVAGVPAFFVGIYDACVRGINWLNGLLIPLGATAAGAGIGAIIGMLGGPVGAAIGSLVGLAVGLIVDLIILYVQKFEVIYGWLFENVCQPIISAFATTFDTVVGTIQKVPGRIREAFSGLHTWVSELPTTLTNTFDDFLEYLDKLPSKISAKLGKVSENISKWFSDLWKPIKEYDWGNLGYNMGQWFGSAVKKALDIVTNKIPSFLSKLFSSIKDGFTRFFTKTLPTFFSDTIPGVIVACANFFKELPDKIAKVVTSMKEGFKSIGKAILDGIFEGLSTIGSSITKFCQGFVNGFKKALGIHSPSTVFADIGKYIASGLFKGVDDNTTEQPYKKVWERVVTWSNKLFGTSSGKSTVFDKIGSLVAGGLFSGVDTNTKQNDYDSVYVRLKDWANNLFGTNSGKSTVFDGIGKNVAGGLFGGVDTNTKQSDYDPVWTRLKTWANNLFGTNGGNSTVFDKIGSFVAGGLRLGVDTNTTSQPYLDVWGRLETWANSVFGIEDTIGGKGSRVFYKEGEYIASSLKNAISNIISKDTFITIFTRIGQGATAAKTAIIESMNSIITKVTTFLNTCISGVNSLINRVKDTPGLGWLNLSQIKTVSVPLIPMANGGFLDSGQMFIAREAGPEMVGSIGRRTAVANNDQIVAGIASGVASANTESNALLREQNNLLRAMLEKETGVYLDGKTITKSVEKHQRERGRVLVTGGAY